MKRPVLPEGVAADAPHCDGVAQAGYCEEGSR